MDDCFKILDESYARANKHLEKPFIADAGMQAKIEAVALCLKNRAGVRALLAGLLAKLHTPSVDIRKPFMDITGQTGDDNYSGRYYDERHIQRLVEKPYSLPINATTAFLTPGFRTKNVVLTTEVQLGGRPAEMYEALLKIFEDIQRERVTARSAMDETFRLLVIERDQRRAAIQNLVRDIRRATDHLPLSAEATVALIGQHMACKYSSRIPVFVVAAAYRAAERQLGQTVRKLNPHNAADKQTGAFGDIEVTIAGADGVTTAYEMKMKAVTIGDVNLALQKLANGGTSIRNYIFITTEPILQEARPYAATLYEELGGVEMAILDCLGFLRYFLHLFHALRTEFLEAYQDLLLAEPESAVSHALKEAFLTLRKTAEGAQ